MDADDLAAETELIRKRMVRSPSVTLNLENYESSIANMRSEFGTD